MRTVEFRFVKKSIVVFLLVASLFAAGLVAIGSYVFRIHDSPTCMVLEFSVPKGRGPELLERVEKMLRPQFVLRTPGGQIWNASFADVFVHIQEGQVGLIHSCKHPNDAIGWQKTALQFEALLNSVTQVNSASLQLDNLEYGCNPNCQVSVHLPLDFPQLNRTVLAGKRKADSSDLVR